MANRPRPHSNAAGTKIATLRSAATSVNRLRWSDVVPPAVDPDVRRVELQLLDAIFAARSPDDWSAIDIILVSRLAAQMAVLMRDEDHLRRSGSLIRSPSNSAYFLRNPLLDAVATRSAQVGQLMRQLGLAVPAVDKRQLAASARVIDSVRAFDDADSDGLFAKPLQ